MVSGELQLNGKISVNNAVCACILMGSNEMWIIYNISTFKWFIRISNKPLVKSSKFTRNYEFLRLPVTSCTSQIVGDGIFHLKTCI